ncbi:unnamed protein product [Hymenolepis diminuta]|uniref:C3H1-type domain-containing protein n=1 Tax=Hymenolepis diminuta TaxID=6216 RepID=A0A0R3SDB2_HYMDI|nr:unnamed protein product [Hymenolepis diminuta]
MADTEKKICRYFNTIGGCWEKSSNGCIYGENCHFSHASGSLKLVERSISKFSNTEKVPKDSQESKCNSDRNNNSMAISSRLIISDPPQTRDCTKDPIDLQVEISDSFITPVDNNREANGENNDVLSMVADVKECFADSKFQQEQLTLDSQIMCGTCKRVLERRGNESYCNLLKDHYLECFLDKDGDHVKCVKMKAALEAGQMYWCKSCILIFEKPWSLFQHMADKAKGVKVQRWEKKVHLDWIDSVAGLMAGHDLGLFSLMKLRIDLRNLLADQYTMEEEMEMAAAAMVQWLVPITTNPWRIHQREVMRKIENLHRQLVRRAGGAAELTRVALAAGSSNFIPPSLYGSRISSLDFRPKQVLNSAGDYPNVQSHFPSTREVDEHGLQPENELATSEKNPINPAVNEFGCQNEPALEMTLPNDAEWHVAGASGDHPPEHYADAQPTQHKTVINNRQFGSSDSTYTKVNTYRQCDINLGRRNSYNMPTRSFRSAIASLNRDQGFNSAYRQYEKSRSKSFSESLRQSASARVDLNCGFTDEEVEELLRQGIKPWDSEASAALAVLRGEMDHLLD